MLFQVLLKRTRSWIVWTRKVRNEIGKNKAGKFRPKLESTSKVRKWLMKLESFKSTWKEPYKLKRSTEFEKSFQFQITFKVLILKFPTSVTTFQVHLKLKFLILSLQQNFQSSEATFQFGSVHFNFQTFQVKFPNLSLFPTAFYKYTYPSFQVVFWKLSVDFCPQMMLHNITKSLFSNFSKFGSFWIASIFFKIIILIRTV